MATAKHAQALLFPSADEQATRLAASSTFVPNMSLPVHRWFRYSAGFSASWVDSEIRSTSDRVTLLDPFAGSGTTLLAAEAAGADCWGIEAHPFVYRVARAKLLWRSDPQAYLRKVELLKRVADTLRADLSC